MRSILEQLAPVVVGILTTFAVGLLKRANDAVDQLAPLPKQIVALFIAAGLTALGSFLSLPGLPTSLTGLDGAAVSSILSALVAIGIHQVTKSTGSAVR